MVVHQRLMQEKAARRVRLLVLAAGLFSIFSLGCGSGHLRPDLPSVDEALNAARAKHCTPRSGRSDPLVIEWPATERATLDAKLGEGIVAVAYQGCELKVLRSCNAPGHRYEYRGVSKATDGFSVESGTDLYAKLPVGAASLAAELRASRAIRVTYSSVGTRSITHTRVARGDLHGVCAGATHFVHGVSVGAFTVSSDASARAGGSAEVQAAGAGVSSHDAARVMREGGAIKRCAGNAEDAEPGCDVAIQLHLIPVDPSATPLLALKARQSEPSPSGSLLLDSPTNVADGISPTLVAVPGGWLLSYFADDPTGARNPRTSLLGPQGAPRRDSGGWLARGGARLAKAGSRNYGLSTVTTPKGILTTWSNRSGRRGEVVARWVGQDGVPTSPPVPIGVTRIQTRTTMDFTGGRVTLPYVLGFRKITFHEVGTSAAKPGVELEMPKWAYTGAITLDERGAGGVLLGLAACSAQRKERNSPQCRHVARWKDTTVEPIARVGAEIPQREGTRGLASVSPVLLDSGKLVELSVDQSDCAVQTCGNLQWVEYGPAYRSILRIKSLAGSNDVSVVVARANGEHVGLVWFTGAAATWSRSAETHIHVGVLDASGDWVRGPFVTRRKGVAPGAAAVDFDGTEYAAAWTWCDTNENCRIHFTRFDNSDELVLESRPQ